MSRTRNIKPGFFQNEDLAECDPLARLLFAGLWTIADREGRLEDRPKRIKVACLPYDTCDIDKLLAQLVKHGFITRYEVGGQRLIQVLAWHKHQQPHIKEAESNLPEPDLNHTNTIQAPDLTETSTEVAAPHPLTLNLDTSNLNLGVGADGQKPDKPARARKPLETPLPEGFSLTPEMTKYAKDWANKYGARLDIPLMFEAFCNHFYGDQSKRYTNWVRVWQRWVIRELKDYGGGKSNGIQATEQRRLTPEQAVTRQEQGLQQRLDALARRKQATGETHLA